MKIDEVRALCYDEAIIITQHLAVRMHERGIKYDEVKEAILTGEIIEDYPEDFPYPSCLILSRSIMLHVVAGVGEGRLWIITAYRPAPDRWEADFKTRKAVD